MDARAQRGMAIAAKGGAVGEGGSGTSRSQTTRDLYRVNPFSGECSCPDHQETPNGAGAPQWQDQRRAEPSSPRRGGAPPNYRPANPPVWLVITPPRPHTPMIPNRK